MNNYVEFPTKWEEKITYTAKITEALRDLARTALQEGYSIKSYTVGSHIKYLKNIQTARNPEAYIRSIARKAFPDEETYNGKLARARELYKGKEALVSKFETLYKLYYNLPKGTPNVWNKLSAEEADKVLDELLFEA